MNSHFKFIFFLHLHSDRFKEYTPANYEERYDLLHTESFKGVFLASNTLLDFYNRIDIEKEPMIISKDILMFINIVMYLKKGSALKTPIDWQLLRIKENGFRTHLLNKYTSSNRNDQQQKEPQIMEVEHLIGAFYIGAILYVIAMIVFLLEIFVNAHN